MGPSDADIALAEAADTGTPSAPSPQLPMRFEPNQGQLAPDVLLQGIADGYRIAITREGLLVHGADGPILLQVAGADWSRAHGAEPLGSHSNYLRGPESAWRMGVPHFGKAIVPGLLPGIDFVVYVSGGSLEFDLVVAPGADPDAFRMEVVGGTWSLDGGDAVATVQGATLRLAAPESFQEAPHGNVESAFSVAKGALGFDLGSYDASRTLVIDPLIGYGSYLHSSDSYGDYSRAVATAPSEGPGIVYIAGQTPSAKMTAATGPSFDTTGASGQNGDSADAFLAKFDTEQSDLPSLRWVAFIGGNGIDSINDLATDGVRVFAAGSTTSDAQAAATNQALGPYYCVLNEYYKIIGSSLRYPCSLPTSTTAQPTFPTTANAYNDRNMGVGDDAFLAVVSADGMRLEYSTLLGGSGWDAAFGVATAGDGTAVIVGQSGFSGTNLPTTSGAFQQRHSDTTDGMPDAFAAKFDPSKNGDATLVWSTFLGAPGPSMAFDVDLDAQRDVVLVGAHNYRCTTSAATVPGQPANQCYHFPTTPSAFQDTGSTGTDMDAFVSILSADGSTLQYSTLLRSSGSGSYSHDGAFGVDEWQGHVFVTGGTESKDFPTTPGTVKPREICNSCNDQDIFVARLDPAATGSDQLVAGTYWDTPDSNSWEYGTYSLGTSIKVDSRGRVMVGGVSYEYYATFPIVGAGANVPLNNAAYQITFAVGRFSLNLDELITSLRFGYAANSYHYMWYLTYATYNYRFYQGNSHHADVDADGDIYFHGTSYQYGPKLVTPRGAAKTSGGAYTYDPYLAVFDKSPPIAACGSVGPYVRDATIRFDSIGTLGVDAPIDMKSVEWFFDAPGEWLAGGPPAGAVPDLKFGDPNFSLSPSHKYPAGSSPVHYIFLRVKDTSGQAPDTAWASCKVTIQNQPPKAFVTPLPAAAVVSTTTRVTALGEDNPTYDPDTVNAEDLHYFWTLPESEDCLEVPGEPWNLECTWNTKGTHTLSLVVLDPDGAAAFAKADVEVVKPEPKAAFESLTPSVRYCDNIPVMSFVDASQKSLTDIAKWEWDFDSDGQFDRRTRNATYTFDRPGTHKVSLTITDGQGFKDTATGLVTLTKVTGPQAGIRSSLQGTFFLGAPVFLQDVSTPGTAGPIESATWTFGDGTTRTEPAFQHLFETPGRHEITLSVVDTLGCTGEERVRFEVKELGGEPGDVVLDAPRLVASFVMLPDPVVVGDLAVLRDTTVLLGSPVRERVWSVDGVEGHERDFMHRFSTAGSHPVQLTVRDGEGREASVVQDVLVVLAGDERIGASGSAPVADAGSDVAVRPNREVTLDGTGSLNPAGNALAYRWEQVQGTPVSLAESRSARPSFVAPAVVEPETLVFQLTVADGAHRSAPDIVAVRVLPGTDADFVPQALPGGAVQFIPEGVPADAPLSWQFGDGATSTDDRPRHDFAASGTYSVRLVVGDGPDAFTVERTVDVDVDDGLKAREQQRHEAGLPTIAGLPLFVALGLFLLVTLACAVAWSLVARRP